MFKGLTAYNLKIIHVLLLKLFSKEVLHGNFLLVLNNDPLQRQL